MMQFKDDIRIANVNAVHASIGRVFGLLGRVLVLL